ncbi:MAG: hypothetical protein E7537_02665 [Ruminococcaceae bacterium]|nr:hypothetical protein [Oscillospiraceae bacterium]
MHLTHKKSRRLFCVPDLLCFFSLPTYAGRFFQRPFIFPKGGKPMFEKELELIEKKDYTQLLSVIRDMNPVDIANLLSELPENKQLPVFRMLPKDIAAEVFVEMETEMQELLIRIFTDAELHSYLEELYVPHELVGMMARK